MMETYEKTRFPKNEMKTVEFFKRREIHRQQIEISNVDNKWGVLHHNEQTKQSMVKGTCENTKIQENTKKHMNTETVSRPAMTNYDSTGKPIMRTRKNITRTYNKRWKTRKLFLVWFMMNTGCMKINDIEKVCKSTKKTMGINAMNMQWKEKLEIDANIRRAWKSAANCAFLKRRVQNENRKYI